MTNPRMQARAMLRQLLIAQAIIGLSIVLVALLFSASAAWSVLAGSLIGMAGNALVGLRLFAGNRALSSQEFLRIFYRSEIQKFLLTSLLFVIAIKSPVIQFLPCLLSYAAVALAFPFAAKHTQNHHKSIRTVKVCRTTV